MVVAAQEEAIKEGLLPVSLDFEGLDNAPCRVIVGGSGGVFGLVEEQCQVPKGSDSGLHIKLHQTFEGHVAMKKNPPRAARLAFTLAHYAGHVTYDAAGFLEKNKDRCPEDLLVLLRTSRTALVRVAFAPSASEQAAMSCKRGARFTGVVAKFASQLSELHAHLKVRPRTGTAVLAAELTAELAHSRARSRARSRAHSRACSQARSRARSRARSLFCRWPSAARAHHLWAVASRWRDVQASQMHFIRCIKPNAALQPKLFDRTKVADQLRCNSVVQVIDGLLAASTERASTEPWGRRLGPPPITRATWGRGWRREHISTHVHVCIHMHVACTYGMHIWRAMTPLSTLGPHPPGVPHHESGLPRPPPRGGGPRNVCMLATARQPCAATRQRWQAGRRRWRRQGR
mgnify:CR=1 FL=1